MQIGTLVSHKGIGQQIGIVALLMDSYTVSVYFPQLGERHIVFVDDLEVINADRRSSKT